MYTLTVARTIKAPIDVVFEAYTDHEALSQVFGVRACRLRREGDTEKNGLGAVRELDCGPVWLREEITGFDRPHRMDYRIRESRPSADHAFGRVEFAETSEGTLVTWTTIFGVTAPVVGPLVTLALGVTFGGAFRLVLGNVDKRALAAAGR